MVVAIAFYGMATFEGPLMSIRAVERAQPLHRLGHRPRPLRRPGWVGFISFGAIYCLVPWLWKKDRLYSDRLVEWHFWLATTGIVLYIAAMWVSGIMEA